MEAFVGADKKSIALSELVVAPRFLRFDNIGLEYPNGSQPIAQKCESFLGYLPSIKAALNDSNIIHFDCPINEEDATKFADHSTLIEHIRQIVSICDSSRGYSFFMDSNAIGDVGVVSSTLEMPQIARSSFASFIFLSRSTRHLPIEAISNWLNQERNAMDQNQEKRTLALVCHVPDAHQIQEMSDFLKQVIFNIFHLKLRFSKKVCLQYLQ